MPMLNAVDQDLVDQLYSRGPTALLEAGYSVETGLLFLKRPEVMERLRLLEGELKHTESYQARLRHLSKRQLATFAKGAVHVLAAALAGPQYVRDKDGAIRLDAKGRPMMVSPGPGDRQLLAATSILDRLGVVHEAKTPISTEIPNSAAIMGPLVDAGRLAIDDDPGLKTEEERALSRERVRNAMEALLGILPAAKKSVDKAIRAALPMPRNGPGKKKTKKPNDTMSSGT